MLNRLFPLLVIISLLLASCQRQATPSPSAGLVVAASTTILADLTRNVAGPRAQVVSLLPPGADPHEYQASPSDVQHVTQSSLLVMNGLGYETFLQRLLDNAGGDRSIITAASGIQPRLLEGSSPDPHMWLDPLLVVHYVENIRDGLTLVDPAGADVYAANAASYIQQLKDLDAWITSQVDTIPAGRRLLVTNHESMGYFAGRYGFKIVTTVLPGLSTEAQSSARQLADVIDQVRASGAPAIFVAQLENAALADQVAAETGVQVVNDLYLESLTAGAPAPTYIDMMKYNVQRIVVALR